MASRSTRAALPVFLLVGALAVAACGGSAESPTAGSSDVPGSPGPSPDSTVSATGEPGTATGAPGTTDPGIDISDATGALEGVDSYRMTIAVNGEEVFAAVVVREPVEARAITVAGTSIVIIGDEAWIDGSSVPLATVEGLTGAYDPVLLFGAYGQIGELNGMTDLGTESKNGVNARHYRIDNTSPVLGASLPAGAAIDIWVADAGYLVAYVVSGVEDAGGDLSLDITNINDPANTVEQP